MYEGRFQRLFLCQGVDVDVASHGLAESDVPILLGIACNLALDYGTDAQRCAPIKALHSLLRLGKEVVAHAVAPRIARRVFEMHPGAEGSEVIAEALMRTLEASLLEFAPHSIAPLRACVADLETDAFLARHDYRTAGNITDILTNVVFEACDPALCTSVALEITGVCESLLEKCVPLKTT